MHEQPARRSDGFRERGHQVTRLEAFVDAAFAFAVTLLVISVGSLPDSIPALIEALKGVPGFAGSFLLIAMFWNGHHTWSRRYGLDDTRTVVLSLALVFLVLVYVYPLRMLFLSFFSWLSWMFLPAAWRLPPGFSITSYDDVRAVFMIYAVAWSTLGLVMFALYHHAWRQRDKLGLDLEERVTTAQYTATWLIAPLTGTLSFAIAWALPAQPSPWLGGLPGMVYFLMILNWPLAVLTDRRVRRALGAEAAAAQAAGAAARSNPFKRRRRRPRGPRPSA